MESLKKKLKETYPAIPIGDNLELKALELRFREMNNQATPPNDVAANAKINSQFAACKMARFQYQQLRETKPYFFVARIFGHAAI